MASNSFSLTEFFRLFGTKGGDILPGNVGTSRTVVTTCLDLMLNSDTVLYDYFIEWDARTNNQNPITTELSLLGQGQWEGAWALAQLHYDQFLKSENKNGSRLHKGHPLCNLAILGRELGSPSLTRHYALLSSAGDIAWEHIEPDLRNGGYGVTMLEQFESRISHEAWRQRVRSLFANASVEEPYYLEAALAARWFSDAHAQHFVSLWRVHKNGGLPFVDILLNAVENPGGVVPLITGIRFEAASGLLLSITPGFQVDSARRTTDEQIDLVVRYVPDRLGNMGLAQGCGLVECKSSQEAVRK